MSHILWILLAPVLLMLPGLLPARLVAGPGFGAWTFVWAFFFSIVLFPPIAFGFAMLLGTTVDLPLAIPLALAFGIPGFFFPRKKQGDQ